MKIYYNHIPIIASILMNMSLTIWALWTWTSGDTLQDINSISYSYRGMGVFLFFLPLVLVYQSNAPHCSPARQLVNWWFFMIWISEKLIDLWKWNNLSFKFSISCVVDSSLSPTKQCFEKQTQDWLFKTHLFLFYSFSAHVCIFLIYVSHLNFSLFY